jgi:hypothetical protein
MRRLEKVSYETVSVRGIGQRRELRRECLGGSRE